MRNLATIFAVVLVVAGFGPAMAAADKAQLAEQYFNSNIDPYGVYTDLGLNSVLDTTNNLSDKEFTANVGKLAGSCSRPVFMAYAKESHLFMSKVMTKIILQDIEKTFSEAELIEMIKFYSNRYDEKTKAQIASSFKEKDSDKALEKLANKEKKELYKSYKSTDLGKKEARFIKNLPTLKSPVYENEAKKALRPQEPACLKQQPAASN